MTQEDVDAAQPRDKVWTLYDGTGEGLVPGLGLRINPSGTRSWTLDYRTPAGGRSRRCIVATFAVAPTLDDVKAKKGKNGNPDKPGWTGARELAREILRGLDDGVDPIDAARQRELAVGTIDRLFKDYIDAMRRKGCRASSLRAWTSVYENHLQERIGVLDPTFLSKADVVTLIGEVQDKHGDAQGRSVFAVLKLVFGWAARFKDLIVPWIILRQSDLLPAAVPQHRWYTLDELKWIYGKGDAVIRLIAHTATRPAETRKMKWKEVDLDRGTWFIPAANAKSKRDRTVALTTGAVQILREIKGTTEPMPNTFVFKHRGKYGFQQKHDGLNKRIGREAELVRKDRQGNPDPQFDKKGKPIYESFNLRHLRRTIAKALRDDLQIPADFVRLAILGHAVKDRLEAVYMPGTPPVDAARAALQKWCDRLHEVVDADNRQKNPLESVVSEGSLYSASVRQDSGTGATVGE